MKSKILILTSLAMLCTVLMTGCGTASGLFKTHSVITPAVTNYVPVVAPASTNAAGIVTPAVTDLVATVTGPGTNDEYIVNPAVQNVIAGGQQIAPFLPPPANGLATAGLGLLAGVLGIVAKWKSKRLTAEQKVSAIVKPIIAGVEAANNPAVKQAIRSHAIAAGVQGVLDPIVQQISAQIPSKSNNTPIL